MKTKTLFLLGILTAIGVASAEAQNLIQNGSFELNVTGNYTYTPIDWTVSLSLPLNAYNGVVENSQGPIGPTVPAEDGSYVWYDNGGTSLSQSFATTSGDVYSLSFYAISAGGSPDINGVIKASITGNADQTWNNVQNVWTLETEEFTATGSETTLSLTQLYGGAHDNGAIDNVSVTLEPTPEPSTLTLAALGGASLLLFRRRK